MVLSMLTPIRPPQRAPRRPAPPRTNPPPRLRLLRILTLLMAVLVLMHYMLGSVGDIGATRFDDAYFFIRYARHALAGDGFSWNAADGPAFGITSTLYLLVVTVACALCGRPDAELLAGLSYGFGLLACLAMAALGYLVLDRHRWRGSSLPLLIIPWVVLAGPFRTHSLTGMETTLSLLTNTLLAMALVHATRRRGRRPLALLLAAAYATWLARPDNGLYALLLPPLFLLANDLSRARDAVRFALLFTTILILDLALKRALFGDCLPLSFHAKRAGFYPGYFASFLWNPIGFMLAFWGAALPGVLVMLATVSRASLRPVLAIGLTIAATFAYFGTVEQIMGWEGRYYYPSLPFILLAAALALNVVQRRLPKWLGWRLVAGVVLALPVLSPSIREATVSLWRDTMIPPPAIEKPETVYRRVAPAELPAWHWWASIQGMGGLLRRMPPGIVIAASEHGIIGAEFIDMTIIDLTGLHDREHARGGFDAERILARRPDLIWLPHRDYTHAIARLLDSPTFIRDYAFYPGLYDYGIALRRTSDLFEPMMEALKEDFAARYAGKRLADYLAEPELEQAAE